MRLLRNHPFLLLALFTVAVGGAYHRLGIDQSTTFGVALHGIVQVLGFVFINAIKITRRVIADPTIAGIVSTVIGIVPYLLADGLLRRRRRPPRLRS